jgi:hypothetical protein
MVYVQVAAATVLKTKRISKIIKIKEPSFPPLSLFISMAFILPLPPSESKYYVNTKLILRQLSHLTPKTRHFRSPFHEEIGFIQ